MKAVRHLLIILAIAIGATVAVEPSGALAPLRARMEVTKVPQGQWAYLKGTTEPGEKIVFVQRWNGSRWYDITGVAVGADGAFRGRVKPKDRGTYTFRMRSKSGTVVSDKFFLKVLPPPPPTYFEHSDIGDYIGPYFNVPREWAVVFAYDCTISESSSSGRLFILHAVVDGRTNYLYSDIQHSDSGVFYMHELPGRAYIEVSTSCAWSVKAVGA